MKFIKNFVFSTEYSSEVGIKYMSENFIFISSTGMYLWVMESSKFHDINKKCTAIIDGVDEV